MTLLENSSLKKIEGYLLKQAKYTKQWQKRWCVIYEHNAMIFYKTKSKTLGQEIDLFNVYNISYSDSLAHSLLSIERRRSALPQPPTISPTENDNTFQLFTNKKVYLLQCEDYQELRNWLQILTVQITPPIIYQSWMFKRGEQFGKKWKKRFFVLVNTPNSYQLRYYEDKQKKIYKGLIYLHEIQNIRVLSTLKLSICIYTVHTHAYTSFTAKIMHLC